MNLANAGGTPVGVVHRHLPDFKLRLVSTDRNHPARLSWTRFADGTSELVLMTLPVDIEPPLDMLLPLASAFAARQLQSDAAGLLDVRLGRRRRARRRGSGAS